MNDNIVLKINAETSIERSTKISQYLYGLFLEDINYAVDGGLYAEMIKNRSFEYAEFAEDGGWHGWDKVNEINRMIIDGSTDNSYLNKNNTHYARLINKSENFSGIAGSGYLDGMSAKQDAQYNFSVFLRGNKGYSGSVLIRMVDGNGVLLAEGTIPSISGEWAQYELVLISNATANVNVRCLVLIDTGSVDIDMVSLFPVDTFHGRKNGIRKDIGEALAALKPRFLRFPGGCITEGHTLDNAYSWKDSIGNALTFDINGKLTIGDVAARKHYYNLWGIDVKNPKHPYDTTYGIGFYEYFLLCEDLNCLGVPILCSGMSCQFRGPVYGTAKDILPVDSLEMQQYVQDALDLVEFCRGDIDTYWGSVRKAMGHEAPFELRYIGIGNEQWGEDYFEHYDVFVDAFDKAAKEYPKLYKDIEFIVANGPGAGDTWAWDKIKVKGKEYASLVDEHYYSSPDWFMTNTDRYDNYQRDYVNVFVGEYAAKSNTMIAAIAEAAYLTGIERNGDVVHLASYAPLFANDTSNHWKPDLIWFNNDSWYPSVNYYVQQMFSQNAGTHLVPTDFSFTKMKYHLSGGFGLGTWQTAARFEDIKVVDNRSNTLLYSLDCTDESLAMGEIISGKWSAKNDAFYQSNLEFPKNMTNGDAIYFGDSNWENYTLTFKATKLEGAEGFQIAVGVKNRDEFFVWNIGGWGNTMSTMEKADNGVKSGQQAGTTSKIHIETGITYDIKIEVIDSRIICYLDNNKMIDYTVPCQQHVYQVTSMDEKGDMIVKIVNTVSCEKELSIKMDNFNPSASAEVTILASDDLQAENTKENPTCVTPIQTTIIVGKDFIYSAPAYSVSIIRLHPQR